MGNQNNRFHTWAKNIESVGKDRFYSFSPTAVPQKIATRGAWSELNDSPPHPPDFNIDGVILGLDFFWGKNI